jgi:hypothetical protein
MRYPLLSFTDGEPGQGQNQVEIIQSGDAAAGTWDLWIAGLRVFDIPWNGTGTELQARIDRVLPGEVYVWYQDNPEQLLSSGLYLELLGPVLGGLPFVSPALGIETPNLLCLEYQTITPSGVITGGTWDLALPTFPAQTGLAFDITKEALAAIFNDEDEEPVLSVAGSGLTGTGFLFGFLGAPGQDLDLLTLDDSDLVGTDPALIASEDHAGGPATALVTIHRLGIEGSFRGADPGSRLEDTLNAKLYKNAGTAATPVWEQITLPDPNSAEAERVLMEKVNNEKYLRTTMQLGYPTVTELVDD